MDAFWRNSFDFMIITGRRDVVDGNSQALDIIFDMGLNVNFVSDADLGRMLNGCERATRVMYLCCCCLGCSLARSNQYSKGIGLSA